MTEYVLEVKKSKFIGRIYDINSEIEAKNILEMVKKEHKKARHIPYSYKVDNIIRKSDDKEPSNTAGTPIYNLILNYELNNKLVLVIRYFGGIKLGAGLLTRTYNCCANEVIKKELNLH